LSPVVTPARERANDGSFLSEVHPLILPEERALFETLEEGADRLIFEEIFWARRDPNLATPENEFRQQYLKDRETADRRYGVEGTPGSTTDCGRLFILAGIPDRVVILAEGGEAGTGQLKTATRRSELWVYEDRPERRIGFGRLEAVFDQDCRSRGDRGRAGSISGTLDRMAATKVVHPGIDYEVGRDGHLVKPADQSTRVRRHTVVVDAVVTDEDGQPITDLTKADIELHENGVRQSITSLEKLEARAPPPGGKNARPQETVVRTRVSSNAGEEGARGRTFAIVFDDAHLTADAAGQAREVVARFLDSETREGDWITLATPATGVWWNGRMAASREELRQRLDNLQGLFDGELRAAPPGEEEVLRADEDRDRPTVGQIQGAAARYGTGHGDQAARPLDSAGPHRVPARSAGPSPALAARSHLTLETIERALRSLSLRPGRKSLILVSDGFAYDTRREEWRRTVTASLRANTAIYVLCTRAVRAARVSDEGQEREAAGGAGALARETGGFVLRDTEDLALGLRRIADETGAGYLIGYLTANPERDGRYRRIQIQVPTRGGASVRARRGYYAPSSETAATLGQRRGEATVQEAIDSPYNVGDIGLRMTHVVGEELTAGTACVSVVVEVDIEDLGLERQAGKDVGALRFVLVTMNRAGRRHSTIDQRVDLELPPGVRADLARTWLPIVRDIDLEGGSHRVKVVVEDRATGRLGSVVHDFRVPEIRERRLRVSTAVLSDVRLPKAAGEPGGEPALIARRQFTSDATLHCQFEVYGAARLESSGMPRVSASYEVRRSDGALYTRATRSLIEPADDGAVSHVIGFPLRAATPDDYEMVVRIKDELSGQTREIHETFSVTATAGAPRSAAADTKSVGGYMELVERSCGATETALVALSRWSSRELERVAQGVFECDRCRRALKATDPSTSPVRLDLECLCPPPPWARAATLHTDLAFAVEPEADGLFHLGFAAKLLERSGADDLQRRWYRTVGLNLLLLDEPGAARSYLEEGLELFGEDAALLVALGATYESEAWALRLELRSLQAELIPAMVDLARVRAQQRHCWSEAADLYEKALAREPEHAEARLRLGSVELLRGRSEQGLEMLQWVTEHAREPDLVYLAHLFIGREREGSADLDGALRSYRAALDANSLGQAAYVATSHALRVSGRPTAAAEVLERGLATRGPELIRDSWWRYPRARLGEARELLKTMRAEVCR